MRETRCDSKIPALARIIATTSPGDAAALRNFLLYCFYDGQNDVVYSVAQGLIDLFTGATILNISLDEMTRQVGDIHDE